MKALNHVWYMLSMLTEVSTEVTQLKSSILSLNEGVGSFYEYMHVLASHEVNHLIPLLHF